MAKTTVLIMIDGFGPEYLATCPMPNLQELASKGLMTEGKGIMPSVTNVNNVSLVTASYPTTHGITSNYWYNRGTGEELYMESGEYIEAETIFQRASETGCPKPACDGKRQTKAAPGRRDHPEYILGAGPGMGGCPGGRTASHLLPGSQPVGNRHRQPYFGAGTLRFGVPGHHRLRHAHLCTRTSGVVQTPRPDRRSHRPSC